MSYVKVATVIPAPRLKVFEYFCDVRRVCKLMPEGIQLQLRSPYLPLRKGAEMEFEFNRYKISNIWSVKIEDFVEGNLILERQVVGLFDSWTNAYEFSDHGAESCLLTNVIRYEMDFGLVGRVLDDLWIHRDLERLFQRIHENLKQNYLKI